MILSASRRTDIPAYYSDWFMNRLKAGYVLTRNPLNHAQISRIKLSPEVIDCIVFWTKDPKNMMDKLPILNEMGFKYYFQFTLTPYGGDMERNLRDKDEIVETFITLSQIIGKDKVLWRYDPIILNDFLSVAYHKAEFIKLCEKLHGCTNSVTISYVDLYSKLKTNLMRVVTDDEIAEVSQFVGETAKSFGLAAKACCEKVDLTRFGIQKASCIDKQVAESVCGYSRNLKNDKNQREGCGCYASVDIGAYNTCRNGCVYCYANYSDASVAKNVGKHNPNGKLLIGSALEGEKITEKSTKSNRLMQMKLF